MCVLPRSVAGRGCAGRVALATGRGAGGMFAGIGEFITNVIDALGPLGVLVLIALESVVPPIPSEVILPLAGFLVGQGRMSFFGVLGGATAGSVLGALVLYGLGRRLGRGGMERLARKVPLLETDDLDRAQGWFDRHGGEAVLIGRLVPGVRSFISIPAGIERMPVWKFAAYTALGSAAWNAALIGLGWWLGARWQEVGEYLQYVEYAVLVALVGAVGWFVWRRLRRRRAGMSR